MKEDVEWRNIPGIEEYQISDLGQVRRIKKAHGAKTGRHLAAWINKQTGYPSVSMHINNKRVNETIHKLVALAFLGLPPSGKHVVAHNDGSKTNNHWTNLRWDTPKGNMADTLIHGTHNRGSNNGQSKLDAFTVKVIRRLVMAKIPHSFIAREFGICRQTVGDIKNRRRWAHLPDPTPMKYSNGDLVILG